VSTILITGAAGGIGTMLRSRLAAPGRVLRLLDVTPIPAPFEPCEEAMTASVTDLAAMTAACAGADAVIHLGGIPSEAPWERILDVNINGTYTVFEAAVAVPGRRLRLPRAGHLLRRLQGSGRGARRAVCEPVRAGHRLH
jgi:uronate dehydrogenase